MSQIHNLRHIRALFIPAFLWICLSYSPAEAAPRNEYWNQRVSLFNSLPINSSDIVFLGNSITDGGEFAELFEMPNIKNRGISGDVVSGVAERLDNVTSGCPAKIFLLIGINDVSHDKTAAQIADEYENLVSRIHKDSPGTRLFIQSVMPINNDFDRYKKLHGKEGVVAELNALLKTIAEKHGDTFINLTPAMADPTTGKLKKEFTNDGLHLLAPGYQAWVEAVKSYVCE